MSRESSPAKQNERLLVKRYQLLELIGSGAMGKVYRAEDKALHGLNVAVKILTRSLDDQKTIARFRKEATINALLSERSINIVKVKDYGIDETRVPFYVMEFLEGENLRDFIQFHDIPLLKFLNLARQICLAMDTAHNGIFFEGEICPIIHRDLKPSNIFIIEDETKGELIKILDFGIAKLLGTEAEDAEAFMGTLRYCSPEQIQEKELDNRSDIYSLGLILYEMLEKRMPWHLETDSMGAWYRAHTEMMPTPFSRDSKVPEDLQRLVMRCLAKSPSERPQSVGEIIQALDNLKRSLKAKSLPKNQPPATALPKINPNSPTQIVSDLKKFFWDSTWPKNKPQQKIVFPCISNRKEGVFTSLWAMLDQENINTEEYEKHYNQFIFQSYPHPMILWITMLYSMEKGPRWLPCYLDLKTQIGQEVTTALANYKEYYVLLFAINKPDQCQDIIPIKVLLKQRTMLKKWASVSQMLNLQDTNQAIVSKRKLKQDFENLKPRIIWEIQNANTSKVYK